MRTQTHKHTHTHTHKHTHSHTHTHTHTEQSWQKLWSKQSDNSNTHSTHPPKKDKVVRAMSAMINERHHSKTTAKSKRSRNIQSAGGTPNKSRKIGVLSIFLPEHSLRAALEEVTKHHGPTLAGIHGDDGAATTIQRTEIATSRDAKLKDQDAKLTSQDSHVNKIFEQALKMFPPELYELDSTNDTDITKESNETNPTKGTSSYQTNSSENTSQDNERDTPRPEEPSTASASIADTEWSLSSFCYECGRSCGVHLVKCFGCQSVWYCSRTCRSESLRKSHKDECPGAQVKEIHVTFSKGLGRNSRGRC